MEPNILEQVMSNLIMSMPTINAGIQDSQYVLIAINNNQILPIEFNNDTNKLHSHLNRLLNESLFKFNKIGKYKYNIPELDLTYDIVEKNSLF